MQIERLQLIHNALLIADITRTEKDLGPTYIYAANLIYCLIKS